MIIAIKAKNGMAVYEVSDKYEGSVGDGKYKKGSDQHVKLSEILSTGKKLCDVDMVVEVGGKK